ncbi:hypothetical protein, partial [Pseudothauera lacus]
MGAPNKRRFGAFGSIDRKYRQWRYLPGVRHSSGARPDGERLVYRVNDTTLEIGTAASSPRGAYALLGVIMVIACINAAMAMYPFEVLQRGFSAHQMTAIVGLLFLPIGGVIGSSIFIGAIFGYTDAPVRFDRARRRIYAWRDHPQGPEEYDWDAVKVVTQDVRGPTQVATSFKSVLLVDEDEHGEVRFSRKLPRIVQIGEVSASPEQALQAYEFVRL